MQQPSQHRTNRFTLPLQTDFQRFLPHDLPTERSINVERLPTPHVPTERSYTVRTEPADSRSRTATAYYSSGLPMYGPYGDLTHTCPHYPPHTTGTLIYYHRLQTILFSDSGVVRLTDYYSVSRWYSYRLNAPGVNLVTDKPMV